MKWDFREGEERKTCTMEAFEDLRKAAANRIALLRKCAYCGLALTKLTK
jgi:hypothetical protein